MKKKINNLDEMVTRLREEVAGNISEG